MNLNRQLLFLSGTRRIRISCRTRLSLPEFFQIDLHILMLFGRIPCFQARGSRRVGSEFGVCAFNLDTTQPARIRHRRIRKDSISINRAGPTLNRTLGVRHQVRHIGQVYPGPRTPPKVESRAFKHGGGVGWVQKSVPALSTWIQRNQRAFAEGE